MNQGKNDDGKNRAALRDALDTRSPDQWTDMLNKLVHDDLTRYWVANTMLHCWRGGKAYGTSLDTLASNYQADTNTRTESDKEAAYKLLQLPFFAKPADQKQPSYKRNGPNRQKISLEGVA